MEKMYNEFMNLKTDVKRWKWILENKDNGITVFLDNDDTFVCFDSYNGDGPLFNLSQYIGDSDGILSLLTAIGIKAEYV